MKKIQLTQGRVALVDDGDYEMLSKYKWFATQNRKSGNWYARTTIMTTTTKCGHTSMGMHRMILGNDFKLIDHKDGDGLNNQRNNLRGCTYTQNQMNKKMSIKTKTGHKGVFPTGNKFYAKCTMNYKTIKIGTFDRVEDAAKAYNEFVSSRFGEFARLNVV